MSETFANNLMDVQSGPVSIVASNAYPEPGQASLLITFADSTVLAAAYWRLIKDGKAIISSFDHQQKYGLPAPIDAIRELQNGLNNSDFIDIRLDGETGDLMIRFAGEQKLQVFNFTGYEIWDIVFPNGNTEYSNYVLSEL